MTYSVRDLVQRFRVTEHTILAWISSGELAAINVGMTPGMKKPRWRVTQEALADFERRRMPNPPAPQSRRRKRSAEDVIERY